MNAKAKMLGMKDTQLRRADGPVEPNQSSAQDLARW